MKCSLLITVAMAFFLFGSACSRTDTPPSLKVKMASLLRCEATEPTKTLVKETARELNLKIDFEYVPIINVEQAQEHRHIGSPTIQINGLDIDPAVRNVPHYGIT